MGNVEFPENFLWGAATSSHQIEGNNRNNDWWKWEEEGRVKEASGKACSGYDLYKEDIGLAKDLGHSAHRFSLEWSRIEPEEGRFDEAAMAHYRDIIKHARALGMEPVVTMNHFTLPLWFSERGGWLSDKSADVFAVFAKRAAEYLGEDVKYWITINEPVGFAYTSFVEGSWPPGHHSFKDAIKVFISLLKAHSLAYDIIHKIYKQKGRKPPMVSIAKHIHLFAPCRKDSPLDILSAKLRYWYFNKLFIDSLMSGFCLAPGLPVTRLPMKRSLDFLGVNYYTRDFIRNAGLIPPRIFGGVCTYGHHLDFGRRNFLKWEIFPQGMYDVLTEFSKYKLPILITENGICTNDDRERSDFILKHLKEVSRAIKDGAPVFGYLHWSLLDNFEWAHGFGPRFGLVEIDYATQERRVRPSARIYARIIKEGHV
ncbi:MAG: glycoside hydrolase family 1 protein [Candidatus Omnitrophota bacterium]